MLSLFFITACMLLNITVYAHVVDRQKVLFNNGWKFYKGDIPGADQSDFDDSSWKEITLPHDWSIEEKFSPEWASGTGYLPGGIGWYRKRFSLPESDFPEKVFVYFDGVYKNSEVWINGHYLGKRPNGFIPFQYELTSFLNPRGKENVMAVKVNHSDFADSRWYTGSGINRNVYLIMTDPLRIDPWGVKFSTGIGSGQRAKAMITVAVTNERTSGEKIALDVKLLDYERKVVGRVQKTFRIDQGGKIKSDLVLMLKDPMLWSVKNPYLYHLQVDLVNDGRVTDSQEIPVGIRSIRFDANKGFFLNDKNVKLKGVCIHDDAGVLGTATPREVWIRRLKTLKEAGCNAIRMSHNPHADYLYDLCDELGLLVQDEAFDEWELGKNKWIQGRNVGEPGKDGYHQYFKDWAELDIKDMIRRNQNHPSIIMWSIGNEIDYPNDPYTHEVLDKGRNPQIFGRGYEPDRPNISEIEPIAARLVKWVHETDSTRPVTAALAGVSMSNFTAYPELLDIVGYNYQEYLYEEDHQKYPERVIYGSENTMSLEAWNAVKDHDYICGQFLWTGIDYMGEAGRWPDNHSQSGLLDLAGNPKPEYYFRKSIWTDEPMIYIGVSEIPENDRMTLWSQKTAEPTWSWEEGDTLRVTCFTNCETVELYLNGKSLGRKKPDAPGKIVHWDIPFEEGVLTAKGYNHNMEAAGCRLKTTGKPYAIQASFYQDSLKKGQGGLYQLLISIVDEAGNTVPSADNDVTVRSEGAILLGIENGNPNGETDYQANTRKANKGKLVAYIQSPSEKGKVSIHLTSPGLLSKTIDVDTASRSLFSTQK